MGKLNQLSIPLLFKKIMNTGFSGELSLKGNKISKNLFFNNGNLVFAKSDLSSDQLGEMLLVLGKINEDQYNHISGLAHCGDNVVCEILVQSNFITEEDLVFARLHQVRNIAVSSFQMKILNLEKTAKVPDIYIKDISIPLSAVIIEGVRTMKDLSLFKNKVQYFVPSPSNIPDPIKNILSHKQVQFYKKLHKYNGMSNVEIINALTLDPLEYWKDMFIFFLLELIEFKKHTNGNDMNQDVQNLISLKKKLLKQGIDYYQLFSINKNSDMDEINNHFEHLFQKYDVEQFSSALSPKIINISQSVSAKLKQIKQEMTNQIEINMKKAEKYESIDINEEQEELEIVIENNDVENMDDEIETIDLTDEYRLEAEIPNTDDKMDTIDLTDEHILEPEKLEKEHENIKIAHPQQDETLQQAQEQYDMGLYQNVINMLRNASKKTDTKGEIYYLLGLSQSHFKESYFEAEMSLKKAVELNPWSSGPTYALGNLYKKQGKKKLAQKCFERVMSMTANHGEAVKAVQLLMKKKTKQSFQIF